MGQWGVGSPQTRPACSSLSLLLCPSLEGRVGEGGFWVSREIWSVLTQHPSPLGT